MSSQGENCAITLSIKNECLIILYGKTALADVLALELDRKNFGYWMLETLHLQSFKHAYWWMVVRLLRMNNSPHQRFLSREDEKTSKSYSI